MYGIALNHTCCPVSRGQVSSTQGGGEETDPADIEFVPEAVEVEDDESTLKDTDEPENAGQELDTLADDADMSMEDLLKLYPGYGGGEANEDDEVEGEVEDEDEDEGEGEDDDENENENENENKNENENENENENDADEADEADEAAKDDDDESRTTRGTRASKRRRTDSPDEPRPEPRASRSKVTKVDTAEVGAEAEVEEDAGENAAAATATATVATTRESTPPKELEEKRAKAEKFTPKGQTLEASAVKTPVPFLLKATLRPYQHIGLDWLANMYGRKLNGILADEMGLGKTIQTISLLAHLATEKGIWGPHLVIVPTSVMLNWEMEFKKFCPALKILTYYGSIAERKQKRQGWSKDGTFHVCITSYKLAVQDHQAFRRKKWRYLILDEAHQIKNFESKRWQTLLGFSSKRRLLLTGTPLQNNLMELWSLMHFLMPHIFQSHAQFKEWFGNPMAGMVDGTKPSSKEQQLRDQEKIHRLHTLLRPFLLRRLKSEVEKQMPKKYEHVVSCGLSKRQRFLYDDFMSRSTTRANLRGGNYLQVWPAPCACPCPNVISIIAECSPELPRGGARVASRSGLRSRDAVARLAQLWA